MNKIGIGFVTYKREHGFKQCLDFIYANKTNNMVLCAVKNKDEVYTDDGWKEKLDHYIHVPGHVGVGYCKNRVLEYFLKEDCTDIFLIEDDHVVKDMNVFDVYINTAKAFGIKQLNAMRDMNKRKYVLANSGVESELKLALYGNCLTAGFSYFDANALKRVGLFDERFINAFEHVEHTIRYIPLKWHPPYDYWADIEDSTKYIDVVHNGLSTITPNSDSTDEQRILYKTDYANGNTLFNAIIAGYNNAVICRNLSTIDRVRAYFSGK